MKVLPITLSALCSIVSADTAAFPSAWWSGSKILSGGETANYVTRPVSMSDMVGAFAKESSLLFNSAASPEVVAFVVCDTLSSDDFMPFGAMSSMEGIIARAESSILIPQTLLDDKTVDDVVAASASMFASGSHGQHHVVSVGTSDHADYKSVQAFLTGSKALFSNGKTDFVILSLPTEAANAQISMLDAGLRKLTAGNYLASVMAKSSLVLDVTNAPAARKLLSVKLTAGKVGKSNGSNLHITPSILAGILVSFFMIFLVFFGTCGMNGLGVNDQFWPPHKENRPLAGIIDR